MKIGMFGAAPQTVNLESVDRSTIGNPIIETLQHARMETRRGRWLRFLLAHRCRYCGGTIDLLASLDACLHCLRILPWLNPSVAAGVSPSRETLQVSELSVPFVYRDLVAADLRHLKFAGDFAVAALHGTLLAAQVSPSQLPDLLLPIPLHSRRLAERGFNQAAALAAHIGRHLHLPVQRRWLQRRRATAAQSGLDAAARQRNLQDAFEVSAVAVQDLARIQVRGGPMPRVAVIDDVLTTGATAAAAVMALRSVGLVDLQFWAVARTMPTNITSPTY